MSGLNERGKKMKNERLFEILLYLIEKKDTTATELAEKFNVSVRTIYRDIDSLTLANIPIYTTSGNQGGIHLMENYTLKKTHFTPEEREDILLALQTIQSIPSSSLDSALKKINTLFQLPQQTENWLEVNFSRWGTNNIFDNELFQTIKENILQKNQIQIEYANSNGELSTRTIEPIKLIFRFKNWYLYAYCHKRNDYRLFKLNRIVYIYPTKTQCEHTQEYVPYSFNTTASSEPQITFIAIFPIKVIHYVYDIFSPNNIEILSSKELKVSTKINDTEWFRSFLLFFGSNIKIIEPQDLADAIRQIHLEAAHV